MIEYITLEEAQAAIEGANGEKLLEQTVHVDFAFTRQPPSKGQAGARGARQGGRQRSRSPGARRDVKDEDDEVD